MTDNDQPQDEAPYEGTARRLAGVAQVQTTDANGNQVVIENSAGWLRPSTPAEQELLDRYVADADGTAEAAAADAQQDEGPVQHIGPTDTTTDAGAGEDTVQDKTAGPASTAATDADKASDKED